MTKGLLIIIWGGLGLETDPEAGNHLQQALERLEEVGADEQIRHVRELLDTIAGEPPNL